ncbi:efflux RND transporter periplasmic adaptor subunit [Alteromonas sp. C1M14]|uniref:efflux RND transporter periplasmic adaptor subunit n=1 Tax=Alteromonas sp. C1M14 TaxID=2841567 RepID=UPI001C08281F|nr:efflux RND transporter periplasmic adaptor subunit [Alteromonas sp. C1M14]MBU2977437.1 efflux RND transporter periplasmic adaptor subunit [Alteromonas sp. C1M14]
MQWKKIVVPFVVLVCGYAGMEVIAAAGKEETQAEEVDTRPLVTVQQLQPVNYTVSLTSYGEIIPLESTNLAAQVSGEVVSWNPNFVPGGLVKRGDVLFTIEKDAYEAALLQAQANLSSAQAQLIQEQAQAEVAKKEAESMPQNRITDLYLRKPQVMSAQAAVKSAEAQLRIAQRDLDNCAITAPYDALIISRDIGTGDFVTTGTIAATLNNVESAEINFPVAGFDQHFLPSNLAHTSAVVTVDNRAIAATINRDLGVVDQATRMSHLVARIDDPYGMRSGKPLVKFGSYANIKFAGKTLENVFRVPQELVNNSKIWLLDEEGDLVTSEIQVIREEGTYMFIRGDINGRKIVMTPPDYPLDGMKVKVIAGDSKLVATTLADQRG